jgi:NAD+-dependent protein deacetylase SIR2
MPRPRKRRKIEERVRTTQELDLTSDIAQSKYDQTEALETLLKAVRNRKKIVVVAGAGISVSAGIPDFRSADGLFRSLKKEHGLKGSGKALFDSSVYKDDDATTAFHDMVRNLSKLSAAAKATKFHSLLGRLAVEGRLLRLYTQNVDCLETSLPPLATQIPLNHKAPWPKTIQLHGGLEKMMCQKCRDISDFEPELFDGATPPSCPSCIAADDLRTGYAGKRSHGVGKLRPRIVLYNEHNPDDEAIGAVTTADMRTRPDCVIVVGTSMKIPAVRRIVHEMCSIVRDRREGTTIWINRDPPPPGKDLENCWDLIIKGDSDKVAEMAKLREWDDPNMEVAETYTEADLDRIKSSQGEIEVFIPPSPTKQDPFIAKKQEISTPKKQSPAKQRLLPSVEIPAMTPPRSRSGSVPAGKPTTKSAIASPVKIKLNVGERSKQAQVKNAASAGKTLAAVLKGKENDKISTTKSKTSMNRKPKVTKIRAKNQGVIQGKVVKSQPVVDINNPPVKNPPIEALSVRELMNDFMVPPAKSEFSSVEVSPVPQTPPPPRTCEEWRSGDTISPDGNVPPDMVKLLN